MVKHLTANAEQGLIPGSGRSPRGGNGNPLQHSCLENPMDRGAWWATVHGVAKSRTRLSNWRWRRYSSRRLLEKAKRKKKSKVCLSSQEEQASMLPGNLAPPWGLWAPAETSSPAEQAASAPGSPRSPGRAMLPWDVETESVTWGRTGTAWRINTCVATGYFIQWLNHSSATFYALQIWIWKVKAS